MIEKTAKYCGYGRTDVQKLHTIAQEMISGSAAILDVFKGTMWAETDDAMFSIKLEMTGDFTETERERMIELTRDNRNAMPKGFFAKLGVLLGDALTSDYAYPLGMSGDMEGGDMLWNAAEIDTMMSQMEAEQARRTPEDQALEAEAKQTLDKLADDIIVSAHASDALITVRKKLPEKLNTP